MRDYSEMKAFEDRLARETPVGFDENRRIFAEMWRHAVQLGVLPPADPLDGLEVDLRLAEALDVRRVARPPREGTRGA